MKKLLASTCIALLPMAAMAGDPSQVGSNDADVADPAPMAAKPSLGGMEIAGGLLGLIIVGSLIGGDDDDSTSGTSGTGS